MCERLSLGPESLVVELASNDGYLLQHFLPKGVPVLGIEPALNVAEAAVARGVETITEFFGAELGARLASERGHADLVLGNNVLAQVPTSTTSPPASPRCSRPTARRHSSSRTSQSSWSISSTTRSTTSTSPTSRSIRSARSSASRGSTSSTSRSSRATAARCGCSSATPRPGDSAVGGRGRLLAREDEQGLRDPESYARFAEGVRESKRALLDLLIGLRREGKQVVGYGAPGKGNTLLNYCGIRTDFLDYTVDRNPYKQGKHTPGTHIPIHPPEKIAETRPEVIVILPWNLAREISEQLAYTAEWGARLVVPVPVARYLDEPVGLDAPADVGLTWGDEEMG